MIILSDVIAFGAECVPALLQADAVRLLDQWIPIVKIPELVVHGAWPRRPHRQGRNRLPNSRFAVNQDEIIRWTHGEGGSIQRAAGILGATPLQFLSLLCIPSKAGSNVWEGQTVWD